MSSARALDEPIPKLCTLVVASPFDAAMHDAFGKVHGRNGYATYGPDFLPHDLRATSGRSSAASSSIARCCRRPQPRMPLFHRVGGLDPLEAAGRREADRRRPARDAAGVDRVQRPDPRSRSSSTATTSPGTSSACSRIDRIAAAAQAQRGVTDWSYSLDFNERCPNVAYLLEFLRRIREGDRRRGFERILYIEQPTARDLKANRAQRHARGGRSCGRW